MRILWLTNHLMPGMAHAAGCTVSPRGGWMPSLAEALVQDADIKLAVATAVNGLNYHKQLIRNIQYYVLTKPKGKVDIGKLPLTLVQDYKRVVEDFRPDLIHVHGTEYYQGLLTARGFLRKPTVVSIQGIINACQKQYWGDIPFNKLLASRTLRDWVRLDGLIEQKRKWARRAISEREVFSGNTAFIGRTLWDRAQTRKFNSEARYYHCDELIRQPFYDAKWDIENTKRHSIFASGANYPLKGFHVLLKAVGLLKDEFPSISVRTPLARFHPELSGIKRIWKNHRSMGYTRYLSDLISAEGIQSHVVCLPSLDADAMVNELLRAHTFILPSFMENSPNSLSESMLVGTPSVTSCVGGVPSMAKDRESALFFSSGDEAVLAEQIRTLFLDDDLARNLSLNSRLVASARHSRGKIVSRMIEIYEYEYARQGV